MRLTAVENNLGERMEYTLDAAGNRTVEVTRDALGSIVRTHSRIFDELSRIHQDLGANGQSLTNSYDKNDNLVSTVNALNNPLVQGYDALDRLTQSTDALSGNTIFEYDQRGNLTKVIDPRGIETSYTYSGFDDLIQLDSGDTGVTVYEYDDAGNQVKQTRANGDIEVRTYDALNRLASTSFTQDPTLNISYSYDQGSNAVGRMSAIQDETGSTAYSYDDRGNVVGVSTVIAGQNYVTQYAYDSADNLTQITYPSNRIVNYQRDNPGRITAITTQADASEPVETVLTSASYQAFGAINGWTHGNGLITTVGYDQDYRMDSLTVSDGVDIMLRDHTYDVVDDLVEINDQASGETNTYGYDALHRLTQASGGFGATTYEYDAVGNRLERTLDDGTATTTETYSYESASNRLIDVDKDIDGVPGGTTTYLHDQNGNIMTESSDVVRDYIYGVNNRLRTVVDDGNIIAEYRHNALGQRVSKVTASGTSLHFHYDLDGKLIAETTPSGASVREYIYLDNMLVGLVVTTEGTDPGTPQTITLDTEDAGVETAGQWNVSTAVSGYHGQNYLVHEANGPLTGGVVVDNGDPGFSTTGTWVHSVAVGGFQGQDYQHHFANGASPEGVELDNLDGVTAGVWNTSTSVSGYTKTNYSHSAAGLGENVITWQLPVVESGNYEVYARWTAHANRASNAKFHIDAGGQTTDVTVDQRINGGSYQLLGLFSLSAGDTISLSNDADGYVIADGLLVIPPDAEPNTATWTFTADETDVYQLSANWTAHPNRASNATYTITTTAGSQIVVANQRESGGEWNALATVPLNAGESVSVALTDVADGYVIADAIQMISTSAPPNQVVWETGLSSAGQYEVYARWSAHPNRASNATYKILHVGGESESVVNQQDSGGSWNYIGDFVLDPDSQILLTDQATGYVVADAIQLRQINSGSSSESTLYFAHTDHLGTPQILTNNNQSRVSETSYRPFGFQSIETNLNEMPLRFPGQYFDRETGWHYNYHRDYDPAIGRYVQSDPIGLGGGVNSYLYTHANPIGLIDPKGLAAVVVLPVLEGLKWCAATLTLIAAWETCEEDEACQDVVEDVMDGLQAVASSRGGGDDRCDKKLSDGLLKSLGIDAHAIKRDMVPGGGWGAYNLCGCTDGRIVLKRSKTCKEPGGEDTGERWK